MNAESPRGTLEDAGATTTARFERLLGHAPTRVWEALTSSDELERWFMPTSLEPRTGGVVSFDPVRHAAVLRYLGVALPIFGLALYVIDWAEGLPWLWRIWEGTAVLGFGLCIGWLSRGIEGQQEATRGRIQHHA